MRGKKRPGLAKQRSVGPEKSAALYDAGYRMTAKSYAFLLAVAAVMITICSKSSPLYPLNDWMDANCFFTVGKSMVHGKVLYRDICEQKGLYLYALHALGYLISHTTFFGVYLLEIAAAFVFLVFVYQTALLFCSDADVLYIMPVLAALVYGMMAFADGDSAEEFCLPLLSYALWVGMKALQHDRLPTKGEYFLIGLTSGCVLFIKYTILGFYVGWFAVPAYGMIRRREWKRLAVSMGCIAAGVMAASLPVLAYFAVHGALQDLWQTYFYGNIFLYSTGGGALRVLRNILKGILRTCKNNKAVILAIGLGFFGYGWKSRIRAFLLCCAAAMMVLVFSGKHQWNYYSFVYAVFIPVALPAAERLIQTASGRLRQAGRWLLPAGGLALALLLNNNAYMLRYTREDLPQFAFKSYIDQVENPTLLNFDFLDGGFYTVCDIVPHNKYFCLLNMDLPEMAEAQVMDVQQGVSDFVVTCNEELEGALYECIAQKAYFLERDRVYRLYALKSLNLDSASAQEN